jgi:Beta-propeller repeat
MKVRPFYCFVFLILFAWLNLSGQSGSTRPLPNEGSFGRLPFIFEANRGQAGNTADFFARGADYSVLLESHKTEIVLSAPPPGKGKDDSSSPSIVTIEFVGANRHARFEAGQPLPGKSNYILGKQSSHWLLGIPQYGQVTQKEVYRGIDLVYYGNNGNLEYDFVIAPGSDPQSLAFDVQGAQGIELTDSGDLLLRTAAGDVRLQKPAIYQQTGSGRRNINGKFVRRGPNEIGLAIGAYDVHSQLIVDPVLSFSTLIGANNSAQVQGIAVDSNKNVFITGTTFATNYPVLHAFQSTNHGTTNVFVTKLNPAGNTILYSTYLGSSGFDNAAAIAIDKSGAAYVTGTIGAADFPTTPGAFVTTCTSICNTGFLTKFLSNGTLVFSTFLGGSDSPADAIAVDATGEAYIAGSSGSNDLPTTAGAFQTTCSSGDCGYVEKLNASGTALVYSTYFGAPSGNNLPPSTTGRGIAVDSSGSAYLVGSSNGIPVQGAIQPGVVGGPNAFVAKFSPDGSSLLFSTYLGGTSPFFFSYAGDFATGVAVDSSDNVHIVGTTSSCEFPLALNSLSTDCVTTSYDQKVFVASLNSSGTQLLFSTLLQDGFSAGIGVDSNGNSYVTGTASSSSKFIKNPIENSFQNASSMGFVTELDPTGKLLFSTYLGATYGSTPSAIAVDPSGGIYVAGQAQSDFPLLHPIPNQIYQSTYYTFFVSKISPSNVPQFSLSPRVSPLLSLRNVSSVPLTISSIVPSSNFTMGGNCSSTITPGGSCNLILLGANDNKTTGSVTITSNAYTTAQQITIRKSPTGDSLGYSLSILPTYVYFPPQLIGTSSATQHILIQNLGLPAAINGIAIIQPSAFRQTNNCPALLDTEASCTISVTYKAATAQDSAQLAIVTDPHQTQSTVFLNGTGSNTAIAVSTPAMEFGNQPSGAPSVGRIVNLINVTPNPATVTGISTTSGYVETNTCSTALPAHGECRVSVTFAATGNQDAPGTLTIANYGPGGPETVSLHATGVQPGDLSLSPNSLSIPFVYIGIKASFSPVTVTNNSKNTITIQKISTTSLFSQTNTCPLSLLPAATCQVTVAFKPTVTGPANGSLNITYSGVGSPQAMPVTSTGVTTIQFSPSPVPFGQQLVGTSTAPVSVFVENFGNYNVTLGAVTVQGSEFVLTQDNCGSSLVKFTGCLVAVVFKPTGTGLRTGTISVTGSDYSQPHIATLQGMGISRGVGSLSTTSITFAAQTVGTKSLAHNVTLTNTGGGTLTIKGLTTSPQFFTNTTTCGKTLLSKASCVISVYFEPTLQGILAGSLSIQDDGMNGQHTIAMTGTGR